MRIRTAMVATLLVLSACRSESAAVSPLEILVVDAQRGLVERHSTTGDVSVVESNVEGADAVALVDDGILVEMDGTIMLLPGTQTPLVTGHLLGSSLAGDRFVVAADGRFAVFNLEGVELTKQPCEGAAGAAWDETDSVLAVVCGSALVLVRDESDVTTKVIPGRVGIDVTHWGDGFAVLVAPDESDRRELYRTPTHPVQQFGLLGAVPPRSVQIEGGITVEALVARTVDGDLLSVELGGDIATIARDVAAISTAFTSPPVRCDASAANADRQVVDAFLLAYNTRNRVAFAALAPVDEIWDLAGVPHLGRPDWTDAVAWAETGWEVEDRLELVDFTSYGPQAGSDIVVRRTNQVLGAAGIESFDFSFKIPSHGCVIERIIGGISLRSGEPGHCEFYRAFGDELLASAPTLSEPAC